MNGAICATLVREQLRHKENTICQARVYLDDEYVMEDAIRLELDADGFLLRTFFGKPVRVRGTLKGTDLLRPRPRPRGVAQGVLLASSDGTRKGER